MVRPWMSGPGSFPTLWGPTRAWRQTMPRVTAPLVIDARPRGPKGPLAGELVLGRCVLAHLLDTALALQERPVAIHARLDEHRQFHELVADRPPGRFVFATG